MIGDIINTISAGTVNAQQLLQQLAYDPKSPMIFSSGIFLWLFCAFIVIYALLWRKTTPRLAFVLAFSYYFYYKSSGTYFILLALVTCTDFIIASVLGNTTGSCGANCWWH